MRSSEMYGVIPWYFCTIYPEGSLLNRGDLSEQANKNISNSLTLILVTSLCLSLLNAFPLCSKYSQTIFSAHKNDMTMEIKLK